MTATQLARELRSALGALPSLSVGDAKEGALFVIDEKQQAWCLGIWSEQNTEQAYTKLIGAAVNAAREHLPKVISLRSGGPPEYYFSSGILHSNEALVAAWRAQSAKVLSTHCDLLVRGPLRPIGKPTQGEISRMDRSRLKQVQEFLRREFSEAWSVEVTRAAEYDGVFIALEKGAIVGVAAHSGHTAALGTFGPIGVHPSLRGSGIGRELARLALGDLFALGAGTVRVPWVALDVCEFYRSLCDNVEVEDRVLFSLGIS